MSLSTSGELIHKLRVVRCPKCRQLLPEYPEYDVYKCGGCGTNLQAKKQKSVAVNSESSTQETDAVRRYASAVVSGDEQLAPPQEDGSKAKATPSSSGELYSDGNVGKGPNEHSECIGDQLQVFNLSNEELESEQDIYKLSLRRNRVSKKGSSNKTTCREIEEINGGNLLSEGSKEGYISKLDENDNGDKSALVGLMPEMEIAGNDSEIAQELNTGNLLPEEAEEELTSRSAGEDDNKVNSATDDANTEVEITGNGFEGAEEFNHESLLLKEAKEELISELNGEDPDNDQSGLVVAKSEVDIAESTSAKTSSTENFVPEKESIFVTHDKVEEGTSGNPASSDEPQKQAQKSVCQSFERVRSVDTLKTVELINHSSELSGNLGGFSESLTTRSGSLSSNDGKNEQFPIRHSDSFESTYAFANSVSEGMTRKGKGLANSMIDGDLARQYQSYLSNGKHHVVKEGRGNQNKVLETPRHGRRNRMRTEREELPSRMPPLHRSGYQSRYGSSSSSNQMYDEVYHGSSFLSRDDTYREKMKIMRMIQTLQDQLNRSRETNGRLSSTGVSYKGKHISAHHSHDQRFPHALDYPRCIHQVNRSRRNRFSRIPYSYEAASSSHHVDHSCSRCYPKPRHFSTDFPPHPYFHHEESRGPYLHRDCFSSRCSYPSRPPLYGLETNSDDQKHRSDKLRRYKRYFRPVAGGAPWVTCRKCLNLLQLPTDFPLSKRGRCQLRCGKCLEVLDFSLQNGRLVSYSSSNLNEQSEVICRSNVTSASHANYYRYSPAESISISYSDDYRLSVSKSYSSEGNPISLTQFHPLHGRECLKPSASCGRFPSQVEAQPPPKSSSLHLLMGYSSPSQVIRETRSSFQGKII